MSVGPVETSDPPVGTRGVPGTAEEPGAPLLEVRTTVPASGPSRLIHRTLLRAMIAGSRALRGIDVELRGAGILDDLNGPFLITPNHVSLIDSPLVHAYLPRRHARRTAVVGGLDFFAPRKDHGLTERLWRRLVVRFIRGAVNVALIDRTGGDYSNLDQLDELLAEGWNLVLFPEATRSRSGELGRMKLGAAELARRYRCPVVPARIEGTREVLPVGAGLPRTGSVRITLGAPLHIGEDEGGRAFTERIGRAITSIETGRNAP